MNWFKPGYKAFAPEDLDERQVHWHPEQPRISEVKQHVRLLVSELDKVPDKLNVKSRELAANLEGSSHGVPAWFHRRTMEVPSAESHAIAHDPVVASTTDKSPLTLLSGPSPRRLSPPRIWCRSQAG